MLWRLLILVLMTACAGDFEQAEDHRATSVERGDQEALGGRTSGDDGGPVPSISDGGGEADGVNPATDGPDDGGDDNGDDTSDDGEGTLDDGDGGLDGHEDGDEVTGFNSRVFFDEKVMPAFTGECTTCHADPRFNPTIQGPLTIFNFRRMENLLREGNSAIANDLYEKVAGIDVHRGGDRCAESPEVCDLITQWWQSLMGDSSTPTSLAGQLASVSEAGRVSGWAADRGDTSAIIPIRIFGGGDKDTGTLIFETDADRAGYDNGTSGDHAFTAELPPEYRDGSQKTIYVYGLLGNDLVLLPGSPQTFTAYTPNPDGETFFENNIRSVLQNRCGSCHAVDYSIQWASLLSPTPDNGGTRTNNELINKPSSGAHGGGNLCGGINGSPCSLFQEWWDLEFGNN